MLIKVASYNIHKAVGTDLRRSPERILAVLTEIDADIVALQEADQRFGARLTALPLAMIAATTPYKAVSYDIRPGSLGWHGNAILVRDTATVISCAHLVVPHFEPRGAVIADVEVADHIVRVVGMHLDLSGLRRRHQAQAIIAQIAPRLPLPTVLMGDLNEWRSRGGCLSDFQNAYQLVDTGPSFHAQRPVASLDRIMISTDLKLVSAGVHNSPLARLASDHLPIWAHINMSTNAF